MIAKISDDSTFLKKINFSSIKASFSIQIRTYVKNTGTHINSILLKMNIE